MQGTCTCSAVAASPVYHLLNFAFQSMVFDAGLVYVCIDPVSKTQLGLGSDRVISSFSVLMFNLETQ